MLNNYLTQLLLLLVKTEARGEDAKGEDATSSGALATGASAGPSAPPTSIKGSKNKPNIAVDPSTDPHKLLLHHLQEFLGVAHVQANHQSAGNGTAPLCRSFFARVKNRGAILVATVPRDASAAL